MEEVFGPSACGVQQVWAIAVAAVAFVVAVLSLVMALARSVKALPVALLALLMSSVPLGLGFVGQRQIRETVERELERPTRTAEEKEHFKIAGYHRASDCVMIGSVIAGFPALLGWAALSVVFWRRPTSSSSDETNPV